MIDKDTGIKVSHNGSEAGKSFYKAFQEAHETREAKLNAKWDLLRSIGVRSMNSKTGWMERYDNEFDGAIPYSDRGAVGPHISIGDLISVSKNIYRIDNIDTGAYGLLKDNPRYHGI